MIDIKLIRENPNLVKENIKKKFQDYKIDLVDKVLELDKKTNIYGLKDRNFFFKLVKDSFRQKRKTIKNNLKEYVDSCLIEYDKNDKPVCVADKDGNHDDCDYNTNCVAK